MSKASAKDEVIDLNGFENPAHQVKNVTFQNITLPENAKVVINDTEGVTFTNVKSVAGSSPQYVVANSTKVNY